METVTDFIHLGSKITADGDCSHEIKRGLLLGRKALTNLEIKLKSKDITLQTKIHIVKALVFPVVMYGCESWIIKKVECQSIDVFELWCWRRFLRESLGLHRDQTSHPKEYQPWIVIERTISKAEVPILWLPRKEWRQKEMGWQRIRRLVSITNSVDTGLRKLREVVKDRDAWHADLHGVTESWT